jgi:hypothetical protein
MLQPCAYKDKKSILIALRDAQAAGELNDLQQQLLFSATRAKEELYDLQRDPHETVNLAADAKHAAVLRELRTKLDNWMTSTNDQGRVPESAEMYDSDMQVYLDAIRRRQGDGEHLKRIEDNIAVMKRWAAEGK